MRPRAVLPSLLLIAVTAVWGWTFVVVRDAVRVFPVLPFLSLRFCLAALALLLMGAWRGSGFRAGLAPGVVLAAAYFCQTLGLQHTTASRAGLLTGLFVVFTPVLQLMVLRRSPGWVSALSVVVAFAGTALLTGLSSSPGTEQIGNVLETLTGLLLALHILLLSRIPREHSALQVAFAQMLVAAAFFSVGALASLPHTGPTGPVVVAVLVTGILASAAGFWVQTYAQQRMAPVRTAVIMVMEPVFAAAFGLLLAGDTFSRLQGLGAILIICALFLQEAAPLWPRDDRVAAA